jgi:hypothetical protein
MAEPKTRKVVSLHRPFLWALLLGAFALGVFVDRGLMLVTGGPQEEPEGRAGPAQLQNAVQKHVERTLAAGDASVSLYFQDLRTGNWFGIREDEDFPPQDLLKLPVMMVCLKQAETDPAVLKKKLTYAGPAALRPQPLFRPAKVLEPGASYTVQDLIYRMLVYGDDEALRLLAASLPEGALDRLYEALSLPYDPDRDDEPFSLRDYAAFFRALYHGSYLNKQMTEKALNYLSRSSFRTGMVAGIPPNVKIAGRFSVQSLPADEGKSTVLLREIGIVYAAGRPYLIGVTAGGEDLKKLSRVVRDISSFIYKEVEQQGK